MTHPSIYESLESNNSLFNQQFSQQLATTNLKKNALSEEKMQ